MTSETMIPLKKVTRQRLRDAGSKGMTYDQILNELLDKAGELNVNTSEK